MSDESRQRPASDPLEMAERVDEACDAFEEEWRAGRRPRIEDSLGDAGEPLRSTLLTELVAVELDYRRRRGEEPTIDQYLTRFPEHAALLSDPTLRLRDAPRTDETVSSRDVRAEAVAHFELLNPLGTGAYGMVWRAHDAKLDRIVALKVPRQDRLSPEELERFLREARAAGRLRHPHIVSVHEVGQDGRTAWIACEYVDGVSLKEWATGRRMTPREAAAFCASLAAALQHAHEQGIVHRGLKPANVIVDRRGQPHVTDFGLAKRLSGEATLTGEGQVMGTPAYMSPEQADGRGNRVDGLSDVYSLGVMLYELLTGRRPFEGSPPMILHQVLHDEPPAPRTLAPGLPRDVETICLKALSKDRSRRYASAAEMEADLRRFLDATPIRARRVGWIERGWRWLRRKATTAAPRRRSLPRRGFIQ